MLLNFDDVHGRYHNIVPIRGIVHVGAYDGDERKDYTAHSISPVMWFEALPETFVKLQKNIDGLEGNSAYNIVLSDTNGTTQFNVTDNGRGNSSSSSILPLGKHVECYPHVKVKKTINLPCARFDTFVKQRGLSLEKFNFLNIDVQGAELRVIRGMGDLIEKFDYVMAEVNEVELYKGGVLLPDLDAYLSDRGFELRDKKMTDFGWGDGLFVRKVIV